ncbi:MAG: chorismate mutase [Methanosphaera sp.]|nr:chorismate mutase [Methanosphaera sp.]
MDKAEAEKLLSKSRERIDEIDKTILDLIVERTSLAQDIIESKQALDMDLFDAKREQNIQDRLYNLLEDKNIDKNMVLEIFDMLATMSKNEQKKYLN